ncbi:hypothetical protein Dimus_039379 [Dionaea muscipula]
MWKQLLSLSQPTAERLAERSSEQWEQRSKAVHVPGILSVPSDADENQKTDSRQTCKQQLDDPTAHMKNRQKVYHHNELLQNVAIHISSINVPGSEKNLNEIRTGTATVPPSLLSSSPD